MGNVRIEVVEDESIIRLDIKNRLRSLGYTVACEAASGEDAIRGADETHPDLVLMDIRLKGDMDGIEAAKEIWTRLHIPVIYLTANADDGTLQRAKLAEPFGYLLKPFEARRAAHGHRDRALQVSHGEHALFRKGTAARDVELHRRCRDHHGYSGARRLPQPGGRMPDRLEHQAGHRRRY